MKKNLSFWHLLGGLILGFGLGLVISWAVVPTDTSNTSPALLRSDYKNEYRALIASAYVSTNDLEKAKERLATLNDTDAIVALENQAQRSLAEGESPSNLTILANALAGEKPTNESTATNTVLITHTPSPPAKTGLPPAPNITSTVEVEDKMATLTPIPISTRTQRPTTEPSLTPSVPYVLLTKDEICSANISEALLMIYVKDASQKDVAGVEIIAEWDDKNEHFFTGLKPELGNGYADFTMDTGKTYSLRIATGSEAVTDLSAPPCQDNEGNHYWGSLRLRFLQP